MLSFLQNNGSWLVAGLALLLGIYNTWRQVRSTPRPDVRASAYCEISEPEDIPDENGDPIPWEGMYVAVTNRGAGSAANVTVTVVGRDGTPDVRELGTLSTDEEKRAPFNRAHSVPPKGTATVEWGLKRRSSLTVDYC